MWWLCRDSSFVCRDQPPPDAFLAHVGEVAQKWSLPAWATCAPTPRKVSRRVQHCMCGDAGPEHLLDQQGPAWAGEMQSVQGQPVIPRAAPKEDGDALLQGATSTFIRTLMRGTSLELLLDDGSLLEAETSLNPAGTHLTLNVEGTRREVPLSAVQRVATCRDLASWGVVTPIQPYLDDRCCTLIIRETQFITFRLDTKRHREYFAACLAFLINKRHSSATVASDLAAVAAAAGPEGSMGEAPAADAWAASPRAAASARSPGQQEASKGSAIQDAVASFVQTLIRGIPAEVSEDDGPVRAARVSLNRYQTQLVLRFDDKHRAIPLQDIDNVAASRNCNKEAGALFLDERCCTLAIRGTELVTLRLDTRRHREYFVACLTFLAAHGEAVLPPASPALGGS